MEPVRQARDSSQGCFNSFDIICFLVLQGNVKDAQYDVDFFRGFDIVLNGLDNMEARRHVNRLTLAAGTPLVESGTEGYLGQVGAC